jgi:murein peptide amidase A
MTDKSERLRQTLRLPVLLGVAASAVSLAVSAASEPALSPAPAPPENSTIEAAHATSEEAEKAACETAIHKTVRPENQARLMKFCAKPQRLPTCASVEGRAIHHIESASNDIRGRKILVLGLIHGDEPLAGEMALDWAARLNEIDSARNSWRIVPMLNPDGLERKTRMNSRGVDLNRNFPTKDWDEAALAYWKKHGNEDPRRFPGESGGSEAETKCVISHIKDFKPDFVVAVHTPYKVLDFDGPAMPFPAYKDLPWKALGNFPGSLGRFLWKDYQIPVLTVELGESMVDSARLQDIVGGFAIEASRRSGQKTASMFEQL